MKLKEIIDDIIYSIEYKGETYESYLISLDHSYRWKIYDMIKSYMIYYDKTHYDLGKMKVRNLKKMSKKLEKV